jgi:hypothetical protein
MKAVCPAPFRQFKGIGRTILVQANPGFNLNGQQCEMKALPPAGAKADCLAVMCHIYINSCLCFACGTWNCRAVFPRHFMNGLVEFLN